jgi:hypothetical protein
MNLTLRQLSLFFFAYCTSVACAPVVAQAPAKPDANRIHWENNTLAAFTKALEETKPLVVVFLADPKARFENSRNLSNDYQIVLNSKELVAFKDRAIFAKGFAHEDEFARRMAIHLKITDYPTLSVIAPRTDQLTETYRMEGFFKIEEIVHDLNLALPKLATLRTNQSGSRVQKPYEMQSNTTGPTKDDSANRQAIADAIKHFSKDDSAFTKSASVIVKQSDEKKTLSDSDKKAIQEVVSRYEAALKAGDFNQIVSLTAGPFYNLYEDGLTLTKVVGEAKRKMLAAMDRQFGRKDEVFPFGTDDDAIRRRLKLLSSVTVLDYDTTAGKVVTMNIEAKLTNGFMEKWKFIAYRHGDSWRIWPRTASILEELGTTQAWQDRMKSLAKAYDFVTADILAGKYRTREAAYEAGYSAYTKITGEDTSEFQFKIDPNLFRGTDNKSLMTPELLKRLEEVKKNSSSSTITESQNKINELRQKKDSDKKPVDDQDDVAKAQGVIKQLQAIYVEGTQLINQATDEAAARRIKPQFMELDKQYVEIAKVMRSLKLSSDQQKGLMLIFQEKMEPAKEGFGAAYRQLLRERPTAYRILAEAEFFKLGESNMEAIAQSEVLSIKHAITSYYQVNRRWPPSLESLKKFHDGSLTDPWGKPYQFEIVNVTGEKDDSKYQPYVWTISQFSDGKKVIGQMPPKK